MKVQQTPMTGNPARVIVKRRDRLRLTKDGRVSVAPLVFVRVLPPGRTDHG